MRPPPQRTRRDDPNSQHTPPPAPTGNERSWGSVEYVVSLRNALDAAGFAETKIVLPDGGDCTQIAAAATANETFRAAIYALGEHYPCHRDCPELAPLGLKFWSSEDQSTVADWAGAGCWGRSLSQNYVRLNATSTISWSTIWSVYPQYPYFGNGLMYAFEPWSGNYTASPTVWTSAHWTQFVQPGDALLAAPAGSGLLPAGGSFVSSLAPARGNAFTLILESLEGACLRCSGGAVPAQDLVFALAAGGALPTPGMTLHAWLTTEAVPFVRVADVVVGADGTLAVTLPSDAMITLTTQTLGAHGAAPPAPPSAPFPLPFVADFSEAANAYDVLPKFFADQAGSFAVRHGVVQQVADADPGSNAWVRNGPPLTLVGDNNWTDVVVSTTIAFDALPADRGDAAPPGLARAAPLRDTTAAVTACSGSATTPANQQWFFGKVAPGYLSSDAQTCLNVPGCDATMSLIYYQCVTTGCECGCPSFTNLQFALDAATGALTTPMATGECVTLLASGALQLEKCAGSAGQVWALNASSNQLSVEPPAQSSRRGAAGPLCLTAPSTAASTHARVCTRLSNYKTFGTTNAPAGYCLRVDDTGAFTVEAGAAVLGSGTVNGFNSSAGAVFELSARGSTISASVGGTLVWNGTSTLFTSGQVAIGSGYHHAEFSAFSVVGA